MQFAGKTIFITGANRGIGHALVLAALEQGASKVYASARRPDSLNFSDSRVHALELNILDTGQIGEVASRVTDTQILINNAGIVHAGSILEGEMANIRADFETNFFANLEVIRAFVPGLEKVGGGRIINMSSIAAYVNFPSIAGYSASKAAFHSLSQAARIELHRRGIAVHIVTPGAIDTDMNKGAPMVMTSPADVAREILLAVQHEVLDIIPDRIGREFFEMFRRDPMELEEAARRWYEG